MGSRNKVLAVEQLKASSEGVRRMGRRTLFCVPKYSVLSAMQARCLYDLVSGADPGVNRVASHPPFWLLFFFFLLFTCFLLYFYFCWDEISL